MSKTLEELYTLKKGLLIIVSGPAGTGKGSLCKELVEKEDGPKLSVSETTRPMRKGDVEGVTYTFVSKEVFESRIEKGYYLEYARVYDNYYGTPKEHIENRLQDGQDVILEIEMQGAQLIKEQFPDAVTVFVLPPSYELLRERITSRGADSAEEIEKRMACTRSEIDMVPNYDYVLVNREGHLKESVRQLESIIEAEKLKTDRILSQLSDD